ncbi:MAG: hypothetical protein QW328_09965 [Nitrososphaerota archaeon]
MINQKKTRSTTSPSWLPENLRAKSNTTKRKRRTKKLRSSFEEKVKKYLQEKNIKFKYEPFSLKYVLEKRYSPDFMIEGSGFVIECKGNFTGEDRKKLLAVRAMNPHVEIKLLFMRDNKLHRKSKMRYSDWAEKHGFDYHVSLDGHIPERWLTK